MNSLTRARRAGLLLTLSLASIGAGRDDLVRARQLYNRQQYDAAIAAAIEARLATDVVDAATLVMARAHLERFRQSGDAADLTTARDALQQIQPSKLVPAERVEFLIGLGESLYFDDRAGAASEQFDLALAGIDANEPKNRDAREMVLDWWASALERQAQFAPAAEQPAIYARMVRRMEDELRRDAGTAAASYWLVAAARGSGDLQRAWDAAMAGWVRASLAENRGPALRADLDRIVTEAIIPERARQASTPGDAAGFTAAMRREWDTLKEMWADR